MKSAGVVLNGRLGKNNRKLSGCILLYCDVHSILAYKHARRYVITRLGRDIDCRTPIYVAGITNALYDSLHYLPGIQLHLPEVVMMCHGC
jgi:hypothetical protein